MDSEFINQNENLKNMAWKDAIVEVLKASEYGMHYTDIAEEIEKRRLREKLGATPANTVNATLNRAEFGHTFMRVNRGVYSLREQLQDSPHQPETENQDDSKEIDLLIRAFGMHWDRADVDWNIKNRSPTMLGIQQDGADKINFWNQVGVYILYNHYQIIYIGQSLKGGLGNRLRDHTRDRLKGRWNRFSWFGLMPMPSDEDLPTEYNPAEYDRDKFMNQCTRTFVEECFTTTPNTLISALEALLIEACEPSQNRKKGNGFDGIEFTQVRDEQLLAPVVSAMKAYIETYSRE